MTIRRMRSSSLRSSSSLSCIKEMWENEVSINGSTPNGWFMMENPIKIDDLGVSPFKKKTNVDGLQELQSCTQNPLCLPTEICTFLPLYCIYNGLQGCHHLTGACAAWSSSDSSSCSSSPTEEPKSSTSSSEPKSELDSESESLFSVANLEAART